MIAGVIERTSEKGGRFFLKSGRAVLLHRGGHHAARYWVTNNGPGKIIVVSDTHPSPIILRVLESAEAQGKTIKAKALPWSASSGFIRLKYCPHDRRKTGVRTVTD